ncbi:MAG: ferritin-like domain-containing protein [Clostridia bacterium]
MNKYILDTPYPSQEGVIPNRRDLQLILKDYSGIVSEFTAISQYFYNHLFANYSQNEKIGQILLQIAIAEMTHLNVLGELVINLGGDPKLVFPRECSFNWWNGGIVTYKKEIKPILKSAILLEQQTIECYTYHAKIASQQIVSDVLLRIVEDENLHLKTFCELLDNINQPF